MASQESEFNIIGQAVEITVESEERLRYNAQQRELRVLSELGGNYDRDEILPNSQTEPNAGQQRPVRYLAEHIRGKIDDFYLFFSFSFLPYFFSPFFFYVHRCFHPLAVFLLFFPRIVEDLSLILISVPTCP